MAQAAGDGVVLYGRHPVREVLRTRAAQVEELLVQHEERRRVGELVVLARAAGVRCVPASRAVLTHVAGTPHHQGVVARVAVRPYAALEALLAVAGTRATPGLFVVLDQVQDPGNVGSIVRTAEGLGAHGVVLPRHQAAGLTPHAAKTAAGALEHLGVARVTNLVRALDTLKSAGVWVIGASPGAFAAPPPWAVDCRGPVALVLGGEDRGLRPVVARACDTVVRIPLTGRIGSLNVAAAAAALLYEVSRQRAGPTGAPQPDSC